MPELRALFEDEGHGDVATYIQSGNVVFTARGGAAAVAAGLETAITKRFKLDVPVLLRTRAQLQAVLAHTPFPGAEPKTLHVAFLSAPPKPAAVKALDLEPYRPDELAVKGTEVYLHLPNGMGRTKLNTAFIERKLGVVATARTRATVATLVDLL